MLYNFYFPLISTQREIRGYTIRETALEIAEEVQQTRAILALNAYQLVKITFLRIVTMTVTGMQPLTTAMCAPAVIRGKWPTT